MCIFSFDSYCQFSKVCTNSCFYQKTQFPLLFSFTYAWYNQLDITFFFFLSILWLWWRSQCGLIDIFLLTGDLSTFSFAISLLNILFYKVSIQVSFAHFKQIVLSFFFSHWNVGVFVYSGYEVFVENMNCKNLFPSCGLPFHSCVCRWTEILSFKQFRCTNLFLFD